MTSRYPHAAAAPGRRVLVLSGGGSRGALDVGFAQALWGAGASFDLIIGSSVGALNGAFLASGGTPDELAEVWRPLRFRDLFRMNWRELFARGMGARSIYRLGRRLGLLLAKLPARFEQLAIPFVAVATDLATGTPVAFDQGDLLPALLASAAIPGMWPPVRHEGRLLVDGSLSAHLPLAEAVRRGATEIWGIRSSCTASPRRRFDRLPAILEQVFGFAVDRTVHAAAAAAGSRAHVLACPVEADVSSLDFSQTDQLIALGYDSAKKWLLEEGLRPSVLGTFRRGRGLAL